MASVRELLSPSPLMKTLLPQMNLYRITYEGGTQFKKLVVTIMPSEDAGIFQNKFDNVAAMPICRSIIGALNDIVFDVEPTRSLEFKNMAGMKVDTPEWFEDFLENADLKENSFSDVMETRVAQVAPVEGWCWVLIDLPAEPDVKNRPYITIVPAQNVIDWKESSNNGVTKLCYLKVIEYADDEVQLIKEWCIGEEAETRIDETTGASYQVPARNTTATLYRIPMNGSLPTANEVFPESVTEFPGEYPIPAVQAVLVRDQFRTNLGVSDLTDSADVQREVLALEALSYDAIRFGHSIIRANEGIDVPAGAGGIVRGVKDAMEVFPSNIMDVTKIQDQQNALTTRLDAYMGRGGTRNIAEQVQSGISIVEERKELHKKARSRARVLEKIEAQILELVCYMMDLQWDGSIDYNTDYEARDTAMRFALLQQAKLLCPMDPTVDHIVTQDVIRMIAPPDELDYYLQLSKEMKADKDLTAQNIDEDEQSDLDTDKDGEGTQDTPVSNSNASTTAIAGVNAETDNARKGIA